MALFQITVILIINKFLIQKLLMIVRNGKLSKSKYKNGEHLQLQETIENLKKQNRTLKFKVSQLEMYLHEISSSKKKYKSKYKNAKQKVEIIELINHSQRNNFQFNDYGVHPTSKTTRARSPVDQHNSIIFPTHQDFKEPFFERKVSEIQFDQYQSSNNFPTSKKSLAATSVFREIKEEKKSEKEKQLELKNNDETIMKKLFSIHQELQKLSSQIDHKEKQKNQDKIKIEADLYERIDQVISKIDNLERINEEILKQKERQKLTKSKSQKMLKQRSISAMRAIQEIGKELQQFKVNS